VWLFYVPSSLTFSYSAHSQQSVLAFLTINGDCLIIKLKSFWEYLLTYSMEQSPSWDANWFAASQEIPRVLWNPKVPHRTHKRPPGIPILSQPNPILTPTSHFLKIHPNIILLSTPRTPQRSLSLRLPHQNLLHISPFPHTCYMPALLNLTGI
jgi:hypothetical protein